MKMMCCEGEPEHRKCFRLIVHTACGKRAWTGYVRNVGERKVDQQQAQSTPGLERHCRISAPAWLSHPQRIRYDRSFAARRCRICSEADTASTADRHTMKRRTPVRRRTSPTRCSYRMGTIVGCDISSVTRRSGLSSKMRGSGNIGSNLVDRRTSVGLRPCAGQYFDLYCQPMSDTLPFSEVKAHLSELADRVERQHDRILVTRNGRPSFVLLSPDDLESLEETLDILKDDELMASLRRSRSDAEQGKRLRLQDHV
jgi:antitoxin YefM